MSIKSSGNHIKKLINALFVLILIPLASGASGEAVGVVINVTDGDTFNVTLSEHDSRIIEDEIRVRLADIDCPETGLEPSNYTIKWLEGRNVSLDIDDKTGQDQYGRWIAVCYIDGKNFNMQLVDAGHAEIDDFKDNEFDPMSWWTGYYPGNKETKVYHNHGCAWASLIEQGNLGFFASPGQAISEGYHPCGKCDPPIT